MTIGCLGNRQASAISLPSSKITPTLKPCVTRTGFRHLRTRHRLTTLLPGSKVSSTLPAATGLQRCAIAHRASMLALPLLPGGRFRYWCPVLISSRAVIAYAAQQQRLIAHQPAYVPTSKRAGLPSSFFGMPAPTVCSRLSWALPLRTRDTSSHATRFDVPPALTRQGV